MGTKTVEEDDSNVEVAMRRYWYDTASLAANTHQKIEGYFHHVLEGTLQGVNYSNMGEAAWAVFFRRLRTDPSNVILSIRYRISARMDRESDDCHTINSFSQAEGIMIDGFQMNAEGDNDLRETDTEV